MRLGRGLTLLVLSFRRTKPVLSDWGMLGSVSRRQEEHPSDLQTLQKNIPSRSCPKQLHSVSRYPEKWVKSQESEQDSALSEQFIWLILAKWVIKGIKVIKHCYHS